MTPNDRTRFDALVEGANQELRTPARVCGTASDVKPRFELYHAAVSLCSHKVRTTFFEKGLAFVSHEMNLAPMGRAVPENYRPGYVRMRMQGAPDADLASGYSGRSATSSEGFDACVVPTLVDRQAERVVVDSTEVCRYLDRAGDESAPRLVPPEREAAIEEQMQIVDVAPHPAVLYGATPGGDRRPGLIQRLMPGIQDRKRAALEKMMASVGEEQALVAAYRAKIAKEMGGKAFTAERSSMEGAVGEMAASVEALDKQLAGHDGPWACGPAYTLADVMWTTHLYRLRWLGFSDLWADRQRVAGYGERAFARPSFRTAVVDWPGAYPPSPHAPEHSTLTARGRFFWGVLRGAPWRDVVLG